jgi:hypothetical protein
MSTRWASGGGAFFKDRIEGLLDEARPGRPRTIDDDQVAAAFAHEGIQLIERTGISSKSIMGAAEKRHGLNFDIRSIASTLPFVKA